MGNDFVSNSQILVIDDSVLVLKMVEQMLKSRYILYLAKSVKEACTILVKHTPDLILLDLEMPGIDGYGMLEILKSSSKWQEIPVIFLTGTDDRGKEEKALNMGAVDYILKPISEGVLKKRIQMHLELRAYQKRLESMVSVTTKQLLTTQDLILDILANITTYRDNDTGAHLLRTTNYSKIIVEKLLSGEYPGYTITTVYAHDIIKSAKLHDIGKIAISDDILLKKGVLTHLEYEAIKMHTTFGAKMIDNSIHSRGEDASFLTTAREIILHHHEWWNGMGYPNKLKGDEIPISARIMAIADVYDALISSRPYKRAFSHEEALRIMKRETGTHFDETLMGITEDLFPLFCEISKKYKDD